MDSNENKDKKEDSYYSYSYVRDGGNENTTWRADDYTNYSYNQAGNSQNRYETPKEKRKWFRKRQKKTERNNGFGMKLAKCAALAAVFGLVAGGVFVGTGYLGMTKLGVTKSGSDSKSVTVESTKIAGTTTSTESTEVGAIDVSGIVDEVMPSIVAITNMTEAQYRNFFGQVQNYESESAGSGIIIGQDNDYLYIVTNNHVVAGATSLTVCFVDDQTVTAEVKGTDSNSDLAVVAVKISDISGDTMKNIKVATMGDSDSVKVGESAIAIGNALGYGQSVTTGVISALDREVTLQDESTGSTTTNALIQTDAAINPGNSGGALLNLQGEVIGINSAKYSDTAVEGMGYAIPIATAKPIIDDLIQRETVDEAESAYLGIAGADITEDVSETYNMPRGIYVTKVVENSAADEAGIQKGDILTAFDGKKVSSMEGMQEMLRYYKAGEKIKVTVQQANNGQYEEKELEVTLGKKVE
ncbi:MAG: trypsin-like peptidase domain-containing protein [Lachnospiraceae bacterium]|nr:trypsin-like peptidase domain-containing protein [Lachnospiraceae bacterium]MDD7378696.1 trypsin-like peptidase domain-containing protein [Lachnospiraceae bacterium]MDY4617757.1 trypsin-like peptidase domain-containing protein [Lachnospiraceae bacterium]